MSDVTAQLASYLPAYVRRRIERQPGSATEFWCDHVSAAVLFADISGFTPLAGRLAEVGPQGAELLARLLNAFYGRLVDIIYDHGGDVIAYAGDAAIALWPGDREGLQVAARRSTLCGLEIQEQLRDYTVTAAEWRDAPQAKLSVKVAIAAGDVQLTNVGGCRDAWRVVLFGAPLTDIAQIMSHTHAGDVVLTAEAARIGGDFAAGELLAGGGRRVRSVLSAPPRRPIELPRSCPSFSVAKAYVPRTVLEHLELGDSTWVADLRIGSAVFLKLRGIDAACRQSAGRLHATTAAIQQVLDRHEGALINILQDDKGLVAICCFGLPPQMHEDDAARAIAASLAIERELAGLGVNVQIGIASGRLFSGLRGNDRRREYSVTGYVANLAARLMSAAGKGILCDHQTQLTANGRATFEPCGAIRLKGLAEPVATYRPLAITRRCVKRPHRLTGRAEELATMMRMLDAAGRRAKQLFLLEGEAGVGKSTLIHELCQEASARGIEPLVGGSDAVEKTTPYFAWRPIVSRILQLEEGLSITERGERVLAELNFDAALLERAALLNSLLNLNLAESYLVSQLTGRARADNLHDLVLRLLVRWSQRGPLVVVLEDTHWLDSASWRLTLAAAQQCPELTLVLSTRPMLVDNTHEYATIQELPGVVRIHLDALSRHDTLALVRERLAVPAVSHHLGDFLFERSQGNPFFVEELLNYLRQSELLHFGPDGCDLAHHSPGSDGVNVPTSIRALITSRIDRLSLPKQLTAKTASVVGSSFRERIVRGVYPHEQHRPHVSGHLDEFTRVQLIRLEREDPDRSYTFKHITIQQVTYDQIPQANRVALHRAIASWYEAHEGDAPANYPLLAHHFGQGKLVEREMEYLVKSGEHALRGFANREAARAFRTAIERAVELDPNLVDATLRRQVGHWHRQLGEASFQLGDLRQAEEHLYRALQLFGSIPDRRLVSARGRLVMEVARQLVHRLFPRTLTSQKVVPADAASAGGLHETALALQRLSELHYLKVDIDEGVGTAIHALNVAERAGRSALLARAYAGMTVVCGLIRRRRLAAHYAQLAERVARQVDDQPTTAYVLMAVSLQRLGVAKWELVEQHARESVEIAHQLQDNQQLALSLTVQAMLACFRGNYDAAEPIEDHVGEVAHASGNDVHLAWSHSGRGECLLRTGDAERAIVELDEAGRLLEGKQHNTEEIRVGGLLAAAHWRAGNRAEAAEAVRQTLARIEKCSYATVSMLEGFAGVVEVILAEWAAERGGGSLQNLLPQAMTKLRWYAKVFPVGRPRWLLHRGAMHGLAGRPRQARRDWQHCLREATRMRLPLEMGLAHLHLGIHEDRQSPHRTSHLASAAEIFEALGALVELDLAKQALNGS